MRKSTVKKECKVLYRTLNIYITKFIIQQTWTATKVDSLIGGLQWTVISNCYINL